MLFGSGSSASTRNIIQVVSRIYGVISSVDNYIRVRGYTDNRPIHNEMFSSNWQLSVSRATEMLLALEKEWIDPSRMAIEGYGEYAPFATNDTEQGRAENRKVVIALSKYGRFSKSKVEKTLLDGSLQNEVDLSSKLEEIEKQPDAKDDNTIKVINLPNGGIRITTREKEQ